MNIRFRGAEVRYYDTRKDDGGVYCRIYFSARADKEVRGKMEWGVAKDENGKELVADPWPAVGENSGKLSGNLSASSMILTPKDSALSKFEINGLVINKVSDFTWTAENDSEGRRKSVRINFIVRSSAPDASAEIDAYFRALGDGLGELKIDYSKQDRLPGADAEQEEEE